MTTVAEMTQWFRKAFTETQSQMLAEATVRLHEDLVRREDFTTLTKTVERLAERTDCIAVAQQQTTQELRELAIMQKETGYELKALAVIQKELSESTKVVQGQIGELTSTTKAVQGQIGELTYTTKAVQSQIGELTSTTKAVQSQIGELASTTKAVQGQIGELASTTKVMQGQIGELTSATKAMQGQIGELTSTSKAMQGQIGELTSTSKVVQGQIGELASTSKATQEQIATLAWAMKDTQKQLGGLTQSVGYGLEAYAMERIPKILTKQLGFLEESSGPEQFIAVSGSQDDIDVIVRGTLDGRPIVFLCEAKTNISPQEVHDFLATADRVRPKIGCDNVQIFYFAYRASPEARAAVRDVGGYLAFPHTILVQPLD